MIITRAFSLTNFLIGGSALCFQVFVLYPWHEKLEQEFGELKAEHTRLLDGMSSDQDTKLRSIRDRLENLAERREQNKATFWKKMW
ncbi:hypothetical protein NA57DRAFT_46526 [Rhizodiscina lignyota]|uniref:Uncharacterized protein n=1 Tax=Rhizodiscina lignyota TaxID=1504668 RepID=A0A9P4M191_9PEZI|nr:hypothetical protein NA57DRAFT_46526 [Rhizodiscina lignyota]